LRFSSLYWSLLLSSSPTPRLPWFNTPHLALRNQPPLSLFCSSITHSNSFLIPPHSPMLQSTLRSPHTTNQTSITSHTPPLTAMSFPTPQSCHLYVPSSLIIDLLHFAIPYHSSTSSSHFILLSLSTSPPLLLLLLSFS
jgi:hypothetical protein